MSVRSRRRMPHLVAAENVGVPSEKAQGRDSQRADTPLTGHAPLVAHSFVAATLARVAIRHLGVTKRLIS